MNDPIGYLDLSELLAKRHLGSSDRRIGNVVAQRRADYKAHLQFRVWLRLSVFLHTFF